MTESTRSKPRRTRHIPYSGITIFVLFFGASLLDALSGAHFTRILFWTGMGLIFLLLDSTRQPGNRHR